MKPNFSEVVYQEAYKMKKIVEYVGPMKMEKAVLSRISDTKVPSETNTCTL
jgi:hypothetical protein